MEGILKSLNNRMTTSNSSLFTGTGIWVITTYPLKLVAVKERIVCPYSVSLKNCRTVNIGFTDQCNQCGNILFLGIISVYINFNYILVLPFEMFIYL